MLELARGLSPRALAAVAALEARTVAVDGGRLKLEWGVLNSRGGDTVEDVLWWDGDVLLGFLGLYAFGAPAVELAGMVDPAARRSGIASALLAAALPLCRDRGYDPVLLVVPRTSAAGTSLARDRGAVLSHSEHALVLRGEPPDGPANPRISVRAARSTDAGDVARLLEAAFGDPPSATPERWETDPAGTVIIESDSTVVGTLRISRVDAAAGIYGFAVDPGWQGRGIGRDALRRVCRQLRTDGVSQISLEVAVDNDHALGLYTSLGFAEVTTEDYYALPLG